MLFSDNIIEAEKEIDLYEYVVNGMRRWYLSLPKYAKEVKHLIDGSAVDKRFIAMNKLLKSDIGNHEMLFEKLPLAFDYGEDFSIGLVENIAAAKKYYDGLLTKLKGELINKVKEIFALENSKNHLDNMSVTSIIKDWCEALDPLVFEQLFSDGTERCLQLFSTITNDEFVFINRLAKLATELRIEDWSEDTYYHFVEEIEKYKNTAENFHSLNQEESLEMTDDYQLIFSNVEGEKVTKRFQHTESSKKGKLLYNLIISDIESMGQAISEQEKRQILMDILKKMC